MHLASITVLDGLNDLNFALLMLRVVGLVVAAHGAQKLFGWFGGGGIAGAIGMTNALGMRNPKEQAYLAGISEFAGGLLLFLGLLTPLGSAMVVATMIVAIVTVNGKGGFFVTNNGYEYNLVLIIVALFLAIAGPGEWSLDNAFDFDFLGLGWGLIALVAAGIGAFGALAGREQKG